MAASIRRLMGPCERLDHIYWGCTPGECARRHALIAPGLIHSAIVLVNRADRQCDGKETFL
ncbi:MAG: hypothetical protein V3T85_12765 [Acidiferrobacterales bacterium]